MDINETRVVILAGGKGTRLKPYTTVFPKPLMPIGEMPILEVVLRQLSHHGFKKVTLAVNHLANLVMTFFGDGAKLGLEISYCIEDRPLGTAGCLSLVEDLGDHFLVMNGDLLTTLDYRALVEHHLTSAPSATIGVFPRHVHVDFGVVELGPTGRLLEYREKPTLEYLVSMGINVFDASVLELIPEGQYLDMPTLMTRLVEAGKVVDTYRCDCEWLDIGRSDDYERAAMLFERSRDRYLRG